MPAKSTPRKSAVSKRSKVAVKKGSARKATAKAGHATSNSLKPAVAVPLVKRLKINPGKPARVLSSQLQYEGPLFRIFSEQVKEQSGESYSRDIIRHNGSVVILAVDTSSSKRDPAIVLVRQYRHAAGQYLYEVPAGKMEPGEDRLLAAKRELMEETGYTARKWKQLTRYFASPGFLGEWMQVFLAQELTPGPSAPDEDESLELLRVPLSELLRLIERGQVQDGKTLISVLSYARSLGKKK